MKGVAMVTKGLDGDPQFERIDVLASKLPG